MSFDTWKNDTCPPMPENMTELQAVDHSIKHWEGYLPAKLREHGVRLNQSINGVFAVTDGVRSEEMGRGSDCAMCQKFKQALNNCAQCPLYRVCGETMCGAGAANPYQRVRENELPLTDMIEKLYEARDRLKSEQQKVVTNPWQYDKMEKFQSWVGESTPCNVDHAVQRVVRAELSKLKVFPDDEKVLKNAESVLTIIKELDRLDRDVQKLNKQISERSSLELNVNRFMDSLDSVRQCIGLNALTRSVEEEGEDD